jgi:hypothetical protein
VAALVEQRRRQLDLEWVGLEEIDLLRSLNRSTLHQFSCSLLQLLAGLDLVLTGLGVLDERGRDTDLAQQLLFGFRGELRVLLADLRDEFLHGRVVHVVRRLAGGVLELLPEIAHLPMGMREQARDLGL